MAEIAGARERLDGAAAWLRDQIRSLAGHITPEQIPEVFVPSDPMIVDWREPLKYQYLMSARVDRPVEQYDPSVIARAAALLGAAGWEVSEEVSAPSKDQPVTTLIATWDDHRLRVRVQEGYGGVVYSGDTPAVSLYTPEPFTRPDPVRTPETVPRGYLLCYECDGLGWCPVCAGRGWTEDADGRERCVECFGSRFCPICEGEGELEQDRLQDWQLNQYPELRDQQRSPSNDLE